LNTTDRILICLYIQIITEVAASATAVSNLVSDTDEASGTWLKVDGALQCCAEDPTVPQASVMGKFEHCLC
jgi:hypothetical protein